MMTSSRFMKRSTALLAGAVLSVSAASSLAAGGGVPGYDMKHSEHDLGNTASLQRGSAMFVNYCMGCHSAQYVRYNRVAEDLELSQEQLESNLMFAAEKPFETMTIAMPALDSKQWFGRTPPDLSLIARSRGADWLFNYLRTFYLDEKGSQGVNNLLLPNAAMPHVLWELQGIKRAVFVEEVDADNNTHEIFQEFQTVTPGALSDAEYDEAITDLVNFLVYIGEPMAMERRSLGIKVISFLVVLLILAFALYKEMWKDVKKG